MKTVIVFPIFCIFLLINEMNHVFPDDSNCEVSINQTSKIDFTESDTISGTFLYEVTSNFASLYDDVDFQRFPAIIIYDTLHSPSTSLYQNGIFTLCADGLCSPFLDEKKRLKLKNQLDSLNSSEIKIVNKNFDEREDMLRNVIGGEETFIYKKIQCTILYSYCGVKNFFVTNFKKENSNEQDYLGFKAPFYQVDDIISLRPM